MLKFEIVGGECSFEGSAAIVDPGLQRCVAEFAGLGDGFGEAGEVGLSRNGGGAELSGDRG